MVLDARGYRLHWADGSKVFEIDQPQVIEFKTATLAGLGAFFGVAPKVRLEIQRPWRNAATPFVVPIHKEPWASAANEVISLPGSPFARATAKKCSPFQRASPFSVQAQIMPSLV